MNNNGQTMAFTFMLGITILVLALSMAVILKQFVDDARAPSTDSAVGLDCGNTSISDFTKAQCIVTDMSTPYFFMSLLGLVGLVWGAKVFIGGSE